jgi:hypothetical protein
VKCPLVCLGALMTAQVAAAPAYVSDELVLGVYAEQNSQGQRLATLHSGASLETLSVSGEFTQVRLNDGTTGWVKSTYLTAQEPASARVKQLEEELDRRHATTPELAEAAARSELEQLKRQLASQQSELEAAQKAGEPAAAAAATPPAASIEPPGGGALLSHLGWEVGAVLAALAVGFWLGYATLARRVRLKFGGLKVY